MASCHARAVLGLGGGGRHAGLRRSVCTQQGEQQAGRCHLAEGAACSYTVKYCDGAWVQPCRALHALASQAPSDERGVHCRVQVKLRLAANPRIVARWQVPADQLSGAGQGSSQHQPPDRQLASSSHRVKAPDVAQRLQQSDHLPSDQAQPHRAHGHAQDGKGCIHPAGRRAADSEQAAQ